MVLPKSLRWVCWTIKMPLRFLFQNLVKELLKIPKAFNKTDVFPVGIYAISEDLDSKYVFADLGLAQELLEYKTNQISNIEIKLKKGADESAVIAKLKAVFKNKITVKNKEQLNEAL